MNHTPYDPNRPHKPYSWSPHPPPSTEELSSLPGYQPPVHRGSISNPPEPSASPHEPPSLINNYHRNAFPVSNVNQAFNPSPDNLPMLPQPSFSQIPFNPYLGTQPFAFPQGPYQSQQALPSHHQSQSPFLPSSAYTPYGAAIHGSPNPPSDPSRASELSRPYLGYPLAQNDHGYKRVRLGDTSFHTTPQNVDQTLEIERTNTSPQNEPENPQAETSDEDDMSMDEGESKAVAQAMIAGGLDPGSASQERNPPPGTSPPGPSLRKRRKKRTGKRGGWSKGMRTGPRPALEPSPEFNDLHQKALNAFIDEQDTEKARDLILQAITINPEIYAAHALLSEIYFARGEDEKAIAALFSGAHSAARDAEVWRQVASACLQHSSQDRQGALQQVSYCYARIIHNDRLDYDARLERAAISKELGNYGKASKDLDIVLEAMPRNAKVMKLIAEVGIATKNRDRAISLYADCFAHAKDSSLEGEEIFTWAHAITYVELLTHGEPPDEARSNAILLFRQLCRWLLGRDEEFFWDDFDDDREWDAEDEPRRIMVPQHIPDIFPVESYGSGLPLELRVQLGMLRLKQGPDHLAEALDHLEWLEPEARDEAANVYEFPDLFLEAANALYAVREHEQALRYFEALRDIGASSDADFWLAIATCYYVTGDKVQAIDCYEAAKEVDNECGEARTQLAKLYTDLEEKEKAMQNAREAVRIADQATPQTEKRRYERKEQRLARKAAENALKQAYRLRGPLAQGPAVDRIESRLKIKQTREGAKHMRTQRARKEKPPPKPRPPPQPRPPRRKPMTPAEKEVHRTEGVTHLYNNLLENADGMREGDDFSADTWTDCAKALIMDFRSNRKFYPNDRAPFMGYDSRIKIKQQNQTEDSTRRFSYPDVLDIPTVYREIPFSIWLDIFLEYALVLAKSGDQVHCYKTITAALDCAVWYHDPNAQLLIYTTYLTCCVALRDEATLVTTVLRWYIRTYEFCTDAFRLFAAINLVFPYATDKNGKEGQLANSVFRSSPMQKYMFRQMMNVDANLPNDYAPEGFGPVPDFMRRSRDKVPRDERTPASQTAPNDKGTIQDSNTAPSPLTKNTSTTTEQPEDMTPEEMDVVLLTLYGHILYANGSFRSALSYFFRAHGLDPLNPVILLTMALCYMHEMMKRQNENRHVYLLQAWAFFEEYADARRASARSADEASDIDNAAATADTSDDPNKYGKDKAEAKSKSKVPSMRVVEAEIEFNRARCWHMLGMSDLAVRSYGKVLAMQRGQKAGGRNETSPVIDGVDDNGGGGENEQQQSEPSEDYTMEAAYAIQTMYALSGNPTMARSVTEKYLVV